MVLTSGNGWSILVAQINFWEDYVLPVSIPVTVALILAISTFIFRVIVRRVSAWFQRLDEHILSLRNQIAAARRIDKTHHQENKDAIKEVATLSERRHEEIIIQVRAVERDLKDLKDQIAKQ